MAVQACGADIKHCSADDREVHEALNQSLERSGERKAGAAVTPNGPGFVETKKEQGMGTRRAANKVSEAIAKAAGLEAGIQIGEHMLKLGRMTNIAGWVYTGVEVVTEVHKAAVDTAKEMGHELHEGNLRDAQNVAILHMAAPKLPKEYVVRELKDRSRASDYAKKLEATLQSRPPAQYLKLVKSIQQSAQAGIDQAKKLGIDSERKLAAALAKHADFAKAYDANAAFRHGVRSQIR